MFYPIGTVLEIEKNSERVLAVIVAVYPFRTECYKVVLVESDKVSDKYRAIKNKDVIDCDGSNFKSTDNLWALGFEQVRYILNGIGVNHVGLWTPMQEELAKHQKR